MYTLVTEFLQPIHSFANVCGVFPKVLVHDSAVSYLYICYQLILFVLAVPTDLVVLINYHHLFNDIIFFTTVLTVATRILFHLSALFVPLSLKHTYLNIVENLNRIQKLLHSVNVKQRENPSKLQQYVWISLALLSSVLFSVSIYIQLHSPLHIPVAVIIYSCILEAAMLQILSVLIVLEHRFTLINWHLDYLNNKAPLYLSSYEKRLFLQNKMCNKNVHDMFVDFTLNTKEISAHKIKTYNQIHFLLFACCTLFNTYFSLQILFFVFRTVSTAMTTCIVIFDPRYKIPYFQITYFIISFISTIWLINLTKLCSKIKTKVRIFPLRYVNILDNSFLIY